jgi:hypothetical protein
MIERVSLREANAVLTGRDRFIDACITGDKVARHMSLRGTHTAMRDMATLRRIVELNQVHPLAQRRFLANWARRSVWQRIRAKIADDDLWFAALRKLLPEYAGGLDHALLFHLHRYPLTLYRGQPQHEPLGMSWSHSPDIAEFFSQWQTGQGGVIFCAKVSAAEIICSPLDYNEGEYVVDPRGIGAAYYDPWDDDPRA